MTLHDCAMGCWVDMYAQVALQWQVGRRVGQCAGFAAQASSGLLEVLTLP